MTLKQVNEYIKEKEPKEIAEEKYYKFFQETIFPGKKDTTINPEIKKEVVNIAQKNILKAFADTYLECNTFFLEFLSKNNVACGFIDDSPTLSEVFYTLVFSKIVNEDNIKNRKEMMFNFSQMILEMETNRDSIASRFTSFINTFNLESATEQSAESETKKDNLPVLQKENIIIQL